MSNTPNPSGPLGPNDVPKEGAIPSFFRALGFLHRHQHKPPAHRAGRKP